MNHFVSVIGRYVDSVENRYQSAGIFACGNMAPACVRRAFPCILSDQITLSLRRTSRRSVALPPGGEPNTAATKTRPFGRRRDPANVGIVTSLAKWVALRAYVVALYMYVAGCFTTDPCATAGPALTSVKFLRGAPVLRPSPS